MPTSFSEQEAIQARIDAATKDERGCMRADAEATLAQINLLMNHKLLWRDERKSGDIAIGNTVQIGCYRAQERVVVSRETASSAHANVFGFLGRVQLSDKA